MKYRWNWPAACLLLFAAGCGHSTPTDPPAASPSVRPAVSVALAHYGSIQTTVHVTGTLVPPLERQATISPPAPGVLADLSVRLGQPVSRGQEVAHLNTRTLDGQIQQAEATLAQGRVAIHQAEANALQQQAQTQSAIMQARSAVSAAQAALTGAAATLRGNLATLDNAQRTYRRLQSLFGSGLVATKDLETARVAVQQDQAQVETQRGAVRSAQETVESQQQALKAAEAGRLTARVKREDISIAREQVVNAEGALLTAQGQRSLYTLRSPIDGRVIAVGASVGETVDVTTRVASIADLSVLEMHLSVPSRFLHQVRAGQPVEARVDGLPTEVLHSRLDLVEKMIDPTSDSVVARARVVNPHQKIANGTYVQADVVIARHDRALLVPPGALLARTGGRATVVVIDDQNVAHATPVEVGLEADGEAEITSGLKSGAHVVIQGAYGLPDGTQVQVAR